MDEKLIQTPEKDPFSEEVGEFWSEVGKIMVRDSIKTIDETAKQIIAVAGILEGLYFHAVAYSDLRDTALTSLQLVIYLAPVLLLMFSLIAALLVFFPETYQMDLRAWKAAKVVHGRVRKSKFLLMRIASINLMLGVVALFSAVLAYLVG